MTMGVHRSVILSAGRSCFTRCIGCYNFFGKNVSLTPTKTIIDFLKELRGIRKITIAGGDPLSRLDIMNLLNEIKELGFTISLDTVGTPLLSNAQTIFYGKQDVSLISVSEIKQYIDLLGIPIDGSSNEIMSYFRQGRKNILDEQLSILRELEINNISVCINTVLHQQNLDDLINIRNIISKFSCVKVWQIFQYMPIGPLGFENRNKYYIDEQLFNRKIDALMVQFPNNSFEVISKSSSDRKNSYFLIDTDGVCWSPKESPHANKEKVIYGNINNKNEIVSLLEKVKNI